MDAEALGKQIREQAEKVRALKADKSISKEAIDQENALLADLKAKLAAIPREPKDPNAAPKKKEPKPEEPKEKHFEVKVPKGTRDYNPLEMAVREKVVAVITTAFKKHGAVTIETPVFELKETLMGKYGEDSKLIYDLADQGGELLSLRYDLTVPFARYIALHRVTNIKRYHISRVYRRDMPSENKGRYREFYQCDFDIAGVSQPMVPDSECIKLMTEILDSLPIGDYVIKFNHRGLLDGMLEIAGVTSDKFRPVCSAVDKLDKEPWETVKAELIQKGCSEATCSIIQSFVALKGEPRQLYNELIASNKFSTSERALKALTDLSLLIDYMEVLEVPKERVIFDLSLARGLDYYTGIIYEGVLMNSGGIGSICGGGRYDDLAGMFMGSKTQVPAVGFSLGLERLFAMMERRERERSTVRASKTMVLVSSVEKDLFKERLSLCNLFWKREIPCEHVYKRMDLKEQLGFAENNGIPFTVIIAKNDYHDKKIVSIKVMADRSQIDNIPIDQVVDKVKELIAAMPVSSDW